MKIVDKYELARCPYGTPFYNLQDSHALKVDKNGNWNTVTPIEYYIEGGLKILTSNTFYSDYDNSPMFVGACNITPDFSDYLGCSFLINEDNIKNIKFSLFEFDDCSADYNDDDRFLVLDKNEFKLLLDELTEYYNKLVD